MKTFKLGGIHPNDSKSTTNAPITGINTPSELRILLSQSIGKPSKAIVKPGEKVEQFQLIAEADGFISANLHAPSKGTVKKIEPVRTLSGEWGQAIILETESPEIQHATDRIRSKEEVEALSPEKIIGIIGDAGIVGMGGAAFPTKVKLSPPAEYTPEILIINGAECEPYLTCDDILMQQHARGIVAGTLLIMKATGIRKAIIGIEENKPLAIAAMKSECAGIPEITVEILKKKYPQGGEKEMIDALLGIELSPGSLPVSAGAIVDNVATAFAVYEAVWLRRPLTQRIITVSGKGVSRPGNYLVPIGTSVSYLIEIAGGIPEKSGKVIIGGPMMGKAISKTDVPVTKATSGIIIMPEEESARKPETPCIRCGRCVNVCPMGLEPYLLISQAKASMWEEMRNSGVMNCIECGSCSFICPSSKPLLDFIKLGKKNVRNL